MHWLCRESGWFYFPGGNSKYYFTPFECRSFRLHPSGSRFILSGTTEDLSPHEGRVDLAMRYFQDFRADDPYDDRVAALTASGIAVWDVLELCTREGSLDSAIDADTAVANDLAGFVTDHPTVRRIFLNGAAAEKLFLRHVRLPRAVACRRLPSTSPAHASSTLAEKTEAWRVVVEVLP